MQSKDSNDDPTAPYSNIEEFAASMPDVSREQIEAVWDYFRPPQRRKEAKSNLMHAEQANNVHVRKILGQALWPTIFWIIALTLWDNFRDFARLLCFVSYVITSIVLFNSCDQCLKANATRIPNFVRWILGIWVVLTFVLIEYAHSDPTIGVSGLLAYAETHGWFVAVMFVWGVICVDFLSRFVKDASSKVIWVIGMPSFCFLVLGIFHNTFLGATARGYGDLYFYFVGMIIVGYIALYLAVHISDQRRSNEEG